MKLLLDTHVFLWWREDSPRLRDEARRAIAAAETAYVSAASAWEAAIKVALGHLRIPEPFEEGVVASLFVRLPITFAHATAAGALPPHHGDPFDRMLIAQAQAEGLMLVTHDRRFRGYSIPILWT